jgi:hypothetical protein
VDEYCDQLETAGVVMGTGRYMCYWHWNSISGMCSQQRHHTHQRGALFPALLGEPVAEAWLKSEDKRSDMRGIRTSLMRTISVPAYVHGQLCFQHEWPKRLTSLPQYPETTLLPITAGQGVRTW